MGRVRILLRTEDSCKQYLGEDGERARAGGARPSGRYNAIKVQYR
jgi:hypothetical protein